MRLLTCILPILLTAGFVAGQGGNLLDNPNFDNDTDHWIAESDAQIFWEPDWDYDGDPNSGSMLVIQVDGDADAAMSLADCLPVEGNKEYMLGGGFFVDGSQTGTPHVMVSATLYDGTNCTGSYLTSPSTNNVALVDQWFMKSTTQVIHPAAVSTMLRISVFNSTTDAFEALADSMFLKRTQIFEDGFESSDTSFWSATVP